DTSGYRSLCRVLSRLHLEKPAPLVSVLAENAPGLHVLVDNPFLLKPPLTDAFPDRLWAECVRPGRTEAAENALLAVAPSRGARPGASLGCYLAAPEDHHPPPVAFPPPAAATQ